MTSTIFLTFHPKLRNSAPIFKGNERTDAGDGALPAYLDGELVQVKQLSTEVKRTKKFYRAMKAVSETR